MNTEAEKKKRPLVIASAVGVAVILVATALILFYNRNIVRGTVSYDDSAGLPADSRLVIQIRDVSYADAAAPLIAETTITDPGNSPVRFRLKYDPDKITDRNTYGLLVQILDQEEKLLFINDTAFDVITNDQSVVNVPLIRVQY